MQSTISTPNFFVFFFSSSSYISTIQTNLLPVLEVIAFFFVSLNQLCHKSVVQPLNGTLCYTEIEKCKFSLSYSNYRFYQSIG